MGTFRKEEQYGEAAMFQCDGPIAGHAPASCGCMPANRLGRRALLGGALALGTAALASNGNAQTPAAPFRIDVHHHYTSPALLAMMKGRRTHQTFNEEWTVTKSLDAMDRGG